ncbi:hypothetical protein PM8797T_30047 [Gimesia maris DSM 8797]|nr:hypothetical protein PM8797T_30047 [Gimesia maris DSM 8797]
MKGWEYPVHAQGLPGEMVPAMVLFPLQDREPGM